MGATQNDTAVVVIGGGPAGYGAAIRGAQQGLDVTLVEAERFGGACLNHGCIPSKALISATDRAHRAANAEAMGVYADPQVDVNEMIAWKDGIVDRLTGGVEKLCKGNGVTLVEGMASFESEDRLQVRGETDTSLTFDRAIVATGSRPIELPSLPFSESGIMDSRAALSIEEAPDSVLIVGAGYIGMELAGVFAKLGTDVTVVELLDSVLPRYDDRLTRLIARSARQLGIDVQLETAVEDWDREDDGSLRVHMDDGQSETAEAVLVAVGREPVTDTVGVDAVGIDVAEDGTIPTDDRQRTKNDRVFAIGDVAGDPMLAHAGLAEGIVASETIAGADRSMADRVVPEVVFTDPELARIGLTPEEVEAAGGDPIVGEFPMQASGRAMTMEETSGLIRIVADDEDGTVLGGTIVGPEASELVGELGVAVTNELTIEELAGTIHAHPTLSEGIMEAAEHGLGQAIHRLNR